MSYREDTLAVARCYAHQPEPRLDSYYSPCISIIGVAALYP